MSTQTTHLTVPATPKEDNVNVLVWLSAGFLLATYLSNKVSDPDLWWHITAGKWMIAHGKLPETELWNRFAEGVPWMAYSWSAEILFAVVDNMSGIYGLYALQLILSLILVYSSMYCTGRIARNMVFGVFVTIAIVLGFKLHFSLRPQCISWALLMFGYLAADTLHRNPKDYRGWVGIVLVPIAWANLHLSFPLGIGAVALWLLDIPFRRRNIVFVVLVCAVMCICTLATPYMGHEWLTLLHKSNHPFVHVYIREFQQATIFNASAGILLLIVLLQAMFYHFQPLSIHWSRLLLTVVFIFAGIVMIKFLPFSLMGGVFLLATTWAAVDQPKKLGKLGEGFELAICNIVSMGKFRKLVISGLFVLIGLVLIVDRGLEPLNMRIVPKSATDVILNNNLPMPILNGFGEGGYLIYRFSNPDGTPRIKVPIDGRTNVNSPAITKAFVDALNGTPQWTTIMDLVKPKTILWESEYPLTSILLFHPDYCLVYPREEALLKQEKYAIFVAQSECDAVRQRISESMSVLVK